MSPILGGLPDDFNGKLKTHSPTTKDSKFELID